MSSHIHTFAPGASITFTAISDITGGRLLAVFGEREVTHAKEGSPVVGAAATDARTGDSVLVLRGGVQNLRVASPVPAGSRVKASGDGEIAVVGEGEHGIGLALTAGVGDVLAQVALD